MKIVKIVCGCYWLGMGIAALCGVEWNTLVVGCACIIAAVGCFES